MAQGVEYSNLGVGRLAVQSLAPPGIDFLRKALNRLLLPMSRLVPCIIGECNAHCKALYREMLQYINTIY